MFVNLWNFMEFLDKKAFVKYVTVGFDDWTFFPA